MDVRTVMLLKGSLTSHDSTESRRSSVAFDGSLAVCLTVVPVPLSPTIRKVARSTGALPAGIRP